MTEERKQWVGQIVNGEFALRQYLGGSQSSSVFLTDRGDRKLQQAAIKLIPADRATTERQLSRWKLAAKLAHPHLLRIFESGRCHLNQSDFLYVVMEYAEENLSQIVPERPLSAAETRDMLGPALEALAYLHAKGFVHGHVKPANIMAGSDQLKLSTDGLISTRESTPGPPGKRSVYDPPEAATGMLSPASDAWSLGVTILEVITQRAPAIEDQQASWSVPENLPAPFLEIVRKCLVVEPGRRITLPEIAAHLNQASPATRSIPLAPVPVASPAVPPRFNPAVTASARQVSPSQRPSVGVPPPRPPAPSSARSSDAPHVNKVTERSRYLIPAIALAVVLAVILGAARLLNRREAQQVSPSAAETSSSSSNAKTLRPVQEAAGQGDLDKLSKSTRTPSSSEAEKPGKQLPSRSPQQSSRTSETRAVRSDAAIKTSDGAGLPGEVLQQDVPAVSAKAQGSIQGKVRVSVKVSVDTSGNVTDAELISGGPSKYFADLAMKSARKWEFAPAKSNGQHIPSEWLLRYEFSSSGTKVYPQQTSR